MRQLRQLAARLADQLRADERGQVGGVEMLLGGVLVFVAGTLLVVNAWAVVDARMTVGSAARAAVRAAAESNSPAQANAAAQRSAAAVATAHGRDANRMTLTIVGTESGAFGRCSQLTVEAGYRVPALSIPLIGGLGHGFNVRARHVGIVDPYRDGDLGGGC